MTREKNLLAAEKVVSGIEWHGNINFSDFSFSIFNSVFKIPDVKWFYDVIIFKRPDSYFNVFSIFSSYSSAAMKIGMRKCTSIWMFFIFRKLYYILHSIVFQQNIHI